MRFEEWISTVPVEISGDPIWQLEVYRFALFAADIGWRDVLVLRRNPLTQSVADQLYRALGSISANLTEGYSRSKGADRAHFFEYSLGSARESRDWYYKSRVVLSTEIVRHRLGLPTAIVGMLASLISHQRIHALRESEAPYLVTTPSLDFNIDGEVPLP
ncbi:MAG: four helix bundle protein [Chloroflexota bacterium]